MSTCFSLYAFPSKTKWKEEAEEARGAFNSASQIHPATVRHQEPQHQASPASYSRVMDAEAAHLASSTKDNLFQAAKEHVWADSLPVQCTKPSALQGKLQDLYTKAHVSALEMVPISSQSRHFLSALPRPRQVIRIYCTKPQKAETKSPLNGLFHHSVFHLANDQFTSDSTAYRHWGICSSALKFHYLPSFC